MLSSLLNIPVDAKGFYEFSFANVDQHRQILTALRKAGVSGLVEYIIDPIPMFDFPGWAYRHQLMHNQQNEALGIAGSDLTAVDFSRTDQLASWIQLHFSEHQQAAAALHIG